MPGYRPMPVSVSGGAGGIEAQCEDLTTLARFYGRAATDVAGAAVSLHGYLFDPGLYSSGLLDPGGLAAFQAGLAAALDGPHGLASIAARCGASDVELRAAATGYRTADRLGTAVSALVGTELTAPPALAHALVLLGSSGTVKPGNYAKAADVLVAEDPGLADLVMAYARSGIPLAEQFYPDGHAELRATGVDAAEDAGGPPRSVAAIMAGLARRNKAGGDSGGAIDVRRLTGADGRSYVVVDIPGTKTWGVGKATNPDVTSLSTNLRALEGQHTSYEDGVLAAMRAAGVRSTDRVMLVGHSEGGMVAVRTATDCARSGEFEVTHVLTAGAPIGISAQRLPASVQVLALENHGDVIPHLDATANPDKPNITTVTVAHDHDDAGSNHNLDESYVPGAADVDASEDPSIRAFLAGADGFFTATDVTTTTYLVTRAY